MLPSPAKVIRHGSRGHTADATAVSSSDLPLKATLSTMPVELLSLIVEIMYDDMYRARRYTKSRKRAFRSEDSLFGLPRAAREFQYINSLPVLATVCKRFHLVVMKKLVQVGDAHALQHLGELDDTRRIALVPSVRVIDLCTFPPAIRSICEDCVPDNALYVDSDWETTLSDLSSEDRSLARSDTDSEDDSPDPEVRQPIWHAGGISVRSDQYRPRPLQEALKPFAAAVTTALQALARVNSSIVLCRLPSTALGHSQLAAIIASCAAYVAAICTRARTVQIEDHNLHRERPLVAFPGLLRLSTLSSLAFESYRPRALVALVSILDSLPLLTNLSIRYRLPPRRGVSDPLDILCNSTPLPRFACLETLAVWVHAFTPGFYRLVAAATSVKCLEILTCAPGTATANVDSTLHFDFPSCHYLCLVGRGEAVADLLNALARRPIPLSFPLLQVLHFRLPVTRPRDVDRFVRSISRPVGSSPALAVHLAIAHFGIADESSSSSSDFDESPANRPTLPVKDLQIYDSAYEESFGAHDFVSTGRIETLLGDISISHRRNKEYDFNPNPEPSLAGVYDVLDTLRRVADQALATGDISRMREVCAALRGARALQPYLD
ncbi:hypothetical protein RHOSPDRAFT_33998 [Rhodotorula sp. JG-1b]|nr:hypothetical protein RHOSPDRAFT_33998 [Rhodotorula sp. JG-1b]